MAATITLIATAGEAQSVDDNTLNTTATVTAAVGDWLVVIGAIDNRGAGGTSIYDSCSDSDGINTYITRAEINRTQTGSPGDGVTLFIATCAVTDALTNATVTAALSDTEASKVALVYRVHPAAGESISFVAADAAGLTGNTTTHTAATVSVTLGNIIFGAAGLEAGSGFTGDSDTANGSWSALDTMAWTIAGIGISVVSQNKTVNATGNQSWICSTTTARDSARSYLVLKVNAAAKTIVAAAGSYALAAGSDVNFRKGRKVIPDAAGSYGLTGTAATFVYSGTIKTIAAEAGSYSLLGTDATTTHGYKLDATTAGSYALTGTDASPRRALAPTADPGSYALTGTDVNLVKTTVGAKIIVADPGSYTLAGTDSALLHAWRIAAGEETVGAGTSELLLETGDSLLLETSDLLLLEESGGVSTIAGGVYALTGSDVALVTSANKVVLADSGSYLLVGTDTTLSLGAAPPAVSTLHIGEWPIDKKKRRAREDARAKEQRARDRFRRAIARLLEGLPPEFDEPDLAEALDNAVQASNLLYALSAPIREINAVNELIDHIRQLRIAQPIAQLHLAQAYNQAHRHLMAKAQEDTVMALLLGE